MPTNYTGSPTAAALAPSGAPAAESAPVAQLPADGEAANVASVHQAMKVPMDWIAWLLKPFAKPSVWALPIVRWRNARQQSRFGIDHLGFPAGKIATWLETWQAEYFHLLATSALAGQQTNVIPPTGAGWTAYYIKTAAGGTPSVSIAGPTTDWPGSRTLQMKVGESVGDMTIVSRPSQAIFHANNSIALEFDLLMEAVDGSKHVNVGFTERALGIDPSASPFISFSSVSGGVWNWKVGDGTSSSAGSTGVTPDTNWHRFRVEWHGAGVDDASVARAVFFIDGVEVGNYTGAFMPSASAFPYAWPTFCLDRGVAGGNTTVRIGPVRYAANTWQDAF